MNQYWDTVQKMLIYLKTRHQCTSSRRSQLQKILPNSGSDPSRKSTIGKEFIFGADM